MVVSLLEGDYTVTIRNDASNQPEQIRVTVVAQAVTPATAHFDTMTADDYFERSGW